MRRKLGFVALVLVAATVVAGLSPRPKGELERLRDSFADLPVSVRESKGPTQGWLSREHVRFEDLAKRLERTARDRPGWIAGKVDRWGDRYSAFYVPALARPWWLRWMGYLHPLDWRSRIVVTVERGYLKKDLTARTPAGHWASLRIVAFSASKGETYVDPFQAWYPDSSSGW